MLMTPKAKVSPTLLLSTSWKRRASSFQTTEEEINWALIKEQWKQRVKVAQLAVPDLVARSLGSVLLIESRTVKTGLPRGEYGSCVPWEAQLLRCECPGALRNPAKIQIPGFRFAPGHSCGHNWKSQGTRSLCSTLGSPILTVRHSMSNAEPSDLATKSLAS